MVLDPHERIKFVGSLRAGGKEVMLALLTHAAMLRLAWYLLLWKEEPR